SSDLRTAMSAGAHGGVACAPDPHATVHRLALCQSPEPAGADGQSPPAFQSAAQGPPAGHRAAGARHAAVRQGGSAAEQPGVGPRAVPGAEAAGRDPDRRSRSRLPLARIGEPFYTTREQGTGLGVSVVKSVAQAHGGAFLLRSRPGQGSWAELVLPVLPQPVSGGSTR